MFVDLNTRSIFTPFRKGGWGIKFPLDKGGGGGFFPLPSSLPTGRQGEGRGVRWFYHVPSVVHG